MMWLHYQEFERNMTGKLVRILSGGKRYIDRPFKWGKYEHVLSQLNLCQSMTSTKEDFIFIFLILYMFVTHSKYTHRGLLVPIPLAS